MIPDTIFKNPFLSWLLTSAVLYSAIFWAYYVGFLSHIIQTDFTYIATGLMGLLVYLNLSLGQMSIKLQKIINTEWFSGDEIRGLVPKYDVISYLSVTGPSIGFLGTVIGLTNLMENAATVSIDSISEMIGNGTGAALYPTGVGLVLFLVIGFQRFLQIHAFRVSGVEEEF